MGRPHDCNCRCESCLVTLCADTSHRGISSLWRLSASGFADGDCGQCTAYNGTFYLFNDPTADACVWARTTFHGCPGGTGAGWKLVVLDESGSRNWYLRAGDSSGPQAWASDPIPDASFNPRGPNTFTRAAPSTQCETPASLAVEPHDVTGHRFCGCQCPALPERWTFSGTWLLAILGGIYPGGTYTLDFDLDFNAFASDPTGRILCRWAGSGVSVIGPSAEPLVGAAELWIGQSVQGFAYPVTFSNPASRYYADSVVLIIDIAGHGNVYAMDADVLDCLGPNTLTYLGGSQPETVQQHDEVPAELTIQPG